MLAPRDAAAAIPERIWGTYVGGELNETEGVVAVDEAGFIYLAGVTSSLTEIATPGAYKPLKDPGPGSDFYLTKFDPSGQRVWGTYYGGPGSALNIYTIAARDGLVAIGGSTNESAGIATPGAFDTTLNDVADGFVACFTTDGELLWGTYIGGDKGNSGQDHVYGLALDAAGDVYAAGATSAGSGLATPGAHQVNDGGGVSDAFLARFDDQGQRVWATLYGGSAVDDALGVALGPGDAVYLGGNSTSTTKIASDDAFQVKNAGMADGFVARFDTSGVRAWATYFGGSGRDKSGAVAAHPDGGVVLVNFGDSPGLATPGTHQQANAGLDDVYVTRFSPAGERLWTTYVGGENSETGTHVALGAGGVIFLGGETASTTGIATPDAFQAMYVAFPAYLAKLDHAGQRVWGTYYGGPQSDNNTRTFAVLGDDLVLAGESTAKSGLATPNAHKVMVEGHDNFMARFKDTSDLGLPCIDGGSCDSGFCVGRVCCDSACDDGTCDGGTCTPTDDTTTTDASTTDASTTDASTTDASTTDASTTDASTTDASTTDTTAPVMTLTTASSSMPPTTTADGSTASNDGTGDGDDGSGAATTHDAPAPTGDPQPDTTGDPGSTSTSAPPQGADTGCGCTSSVASPTSLSLLLVLRRRRRR